MSRARVPRRPGEPALSLSKGTTSRSPLRRDRSQTSLFRVPPNPFVVSRFGVPRRTVSNHTAPAPSRLARLPRPPLSFRTQRSEVRNLAFSSAGAPIFTLSKGRGRIGRPRPNSVRGPPVVVSTPASTFGCNQMQAPPCFTLFKGRGRFRRLRRKSVRGLPRTHHTRRYAPQGARRSSPSPRGEADSAVPGRNR